MASASVSVKASSIALRVRVSLDSRRCVYVRSVKPGSEWPRYSDEAEFFALLDATGVAVHLKVGPSGDALGCNFALPGDTDDTGEPVFYAGSTLAGDSGRGLASSAARRDPFFDSLGRVRVALAYAALGDGHAGLRSPGSARDTFTRVADRERPRWTAFYGQAELDHLAAIVQFNSRRHSHAEAMATALWIPSAFRRNRACDSGPTGQILHLTE